MTTRKQPKRDSIFDAMADKTKKPDALGYQMFDPEIMAAVMRAMRGRP